jgi:uncharacterized UPF0146 family protein
VEGLVNYIASRYKNAVEIGIGNFPDVAFALIEKGIRVFATDVRPLQYIGLKVVVDDIMAPDLSLYKEIEVIYSLRPPPEIVPYMLRLAVMISADMIIKPLSSEYQGGQLMRSGDTTFSLWKQS